MSDAIARFPAEGFPPAAFNDVENTKTDLRSIFGVQGISAQPQNEDTTARGMILNQQYDTTRIGGGIGDALEQVADNIFNWWVQLYYVFYDEKHYAAVLGQMRAVEYVKFSNADLNRRLVVSVAPNSMKPKDEVTEMNQALALWDKQAMDPKTLFTILDFPDPQKTAEQVTLWIVDKSTYMRMNFPEIFQEVQASQQAALAAGGGVPPEQANGEPAPGLEAPPASAALANAPLPPLPTPAA